MHNSLWLRMRDRMVDEESSITNRFSITVFKKVADFSKYLCGLNSFQLVGVNNEYNDIHRHTSLAPHQTPSHEVVILASSLNSTSPSHLLWLTRAVVVPKMTFGTRRLPSARLGWWCGWPTFPSAAPRFRQRRVSILPTNQRRRLLRFRRPPKRRPLRRLLMRQFSLQPKNKRAGESAKKVKSKNNTRRLQELNSVTSNTSF